MKKNNKWNEILEEFRALGGVAENICLKKGKLGRGMFPIDPTKPVSLKVPETLLFSTDDLVFDNGVLRAGPTSQAGPREKAFLERYTTDFAWGDGGRRDVEQFLEGCAELPHDLRELLATKFTMRFLQEEITEKVVQERYLNSRVIRYKEGRVLMPFVELINHGPLTEYQLNDGIAITGKFEGEILVSYSKQDPFGLFRGWGFACKEPTAQSLPMSLDTNLGRVIVRGQFDKGKVLELPSFGRMRLPELSNQEGEISISYLTLGDMRFPRTPKAFFFKLFEGMGLEGAEEKFEQIRHFNVLAFLHLLECLEDVTGPMVRPLRQMARFQLQALAHCYGVRQL